MAWRREMNTLRGSFCYSQQEDALRVTVTPVKAPHMMWLIYGFDNRAGKSAVAFVHWEGVKVPFGIELAEE